MVVDGCLLNSFCQQMTFHVEMWSRRTEQVMDTADTAYADTDTAAADDDDNNVVVSRVVEAEAAMIGL